MKRPSRRFKQSYWITIFFWIAIPFLCLFAIEASKLISIPGLFGVESVDGSGTSKLNQWLFIALSMGAAWEIRAKVISEFKRVTKTDLDQAQIMALFGESFRSTTDGLALTDAEGTFIWANAGMCSLSGYSLEEIIGKTPRLFKSGKHGPGYYRRLWETILAGHIFRGELVNKRKDGSFYTGQVTITPIVSSTGIITHFSVMERDISQRVDGEESLRQSHERFKSLIESMNDGIALLDKDERITYANPVFLSKLGFAGDEVVGTIFDHLLDEENKAEVAKRTQERKKGSRQAYDLEIANKAGDKRIFKVSPTGLFDSTGAFAGSFAIFRDVTQELETAAQFQLTKEKLEAMNLFKSSILDNISHELRTPLSAIIGFSEILLNEVTGEQLELIEHIHSGGHRLLGTLNSVLDMSTVLSENMVKNSLSCDLVQEAMPLIQSHKTVAEEKGLALNFVVNIKDQQGVIDIKCYKKVMDNFLDNAVKFTEKGEVAVELRDDPASDFNFQFIVRDTGIGIDERVQALVFESFHQESQGESRTHNGMGLGLSFSKILVDQMGGRIQVTSLKNVGSEFAVTWPKKCIEHSKGSDSSGHLSKGFNSPSSDSSESDSKGPASVEHDSSGLRPPKSGKSGLNQVVGDSKSATA